MVNLSNFLSRCFTVVLLTGLVMASVGSPLWAQSDKLSILADRLDPFYSAGAIWVDPLPMPIVTGSLGFSLDETIRGMITTGYGYAQITTPSAYGEPVSARLSVVLLEAAALYPVTSNLYIGPSVGVLSVAGGFELPFQTAQPTRFDVLIPSVGVVIGYDLGYFWLTLGVTIALGGSQ